MDERTTTASRASAGFGTAGAARVPSARPSPSRWRFAAPRGVPPRARSAWGRSRARRRSRATRGTSLRRTRPARRAGWRFPGPSSTTSRSGARAARWARAPGAWRRCGTPAGRCSKAESRRRGRRFWEVRVRGARPARHRHGSRRYNRRASGTHSETCRRTISPTWMTTHRQIRQIRTIRQIRGVAFGLRGSMRTAVNRTKNHRPKNALCSCTRSATRSSRARARRTPRAGSGRHCPASSPRFWRTPPAASSSGARSGRKPRTSSAYAKRWCPRRAPRF